MKEFTREEAILQLNMHISKLIRKTKLDLIDKNLRYYKIKKIMKNMNKKLNISIIIKK